MNFGNKTLWTALLAVLCVALAVGCNDTLRQFITQVPGPSGDPAASAQMVFLSNNPAGDGSDTHIDVSGDTRVAVIPSGPNPAFLGKSGSLAFIVNGNGTVTTYLALLQITVFPPGTNTFTLPAITSGSAAGASTSNNNLYIANQNSNDVSVIPGGGTAALGTNVLAGSQPVAIASNANSNKAYVVNRGSNNVTVISAIDNTVVGPPIPVGASPIWAVMSTDATHVFVVNQGDGTVSVIDTVIDKVIPCAPGPSCNPVTHAISVGASPNFAFYDSRLQRLYVNNSGANTLSVIKADGIDIGAVPPVLPGALPPIALSAGPLPTSVTALADGTKAYVARGGCPAGINHTTLLASIASCTGNLVSVIDATALQEVGKITVAPGAVAVASSQDSTRVYVTNALDTIVPSPPGPAVAGGSVSVIRTSTNAEVVRIRAPQQDPNCVATAAAPCPLQTPFALSVFP
ncbi:MAG TPA: YncE family protein [Alphaproteobacteria bacterium]|nr:YncE family protein [Alphaproteobacteria bacterium]